MGCTLHGTGLPGLEDVIAEAEALEAAVRRLLDGRSPLPDEPDRPAAEEWLIAAHRTAWG